MTEKDLITGYFSLLVMMGDIGLLWFGSSAALCGAVLKYTIDFKTSGKDTPFSMELAGLIGGFFVALVAYGLFSVHFIRQVSKGILGLIPLPLVVDGNVAVILERISYFYLFPTLTFFLIAVAWLWIIRRKLQ